MATTTNITREISDEEPNGSSVVTVKVIEPVDERNIEISQDGDRIVMRIEHAVAVHAAMGLFIAEEQAK
jgi:hypothetical protein